MWQLARVKGGLVDSGGWDKRLLGYRTEPSCDLIFYSSHPSATPHKPLTAGDQRFDEFDDRHFSREARRASRRGAPSTSDVIAKKLEAEFELRSASEAHPPWRQNPPFPLNLRLDSSLVHLLGGTSPWYVLSPRADRSGEIVHIIIEIHDQVERPRTLLTFHELSQWAKHIIGGVPRKNGPSFSFASPAANLAEPTGIASCLSRRYTLAQEPFSIPSSH